MIGVLIGGSTQEVGQKSQRVVGVLITSRQDAAQNFLSTSTRSRTVAAEDLAVDHRRADRLLGGPVGRFDPRFIQKREDLIGVASQVIAKRSVATMR